MAAKKNTPAKKAPATSSRKDVALWEEQLAAQADVAAKQEESAAGGQFFSVKGGILTWNDAPLPNNQMAVIILDSVLETVYYEGRYDPDTPQSPVAFAFGRDEKTMVWHENSREDFAGQLCHESDVCQWGSADTGKGKAARETRRLAMIPAGTLNNRGDFEIYDEEHFVDASIGFMKLPVTSVKGFASFVTQIAGTLRRPPHGIITKVRVVPDAKTQFKVLFEPIENIPSDIMGTIMKRHDEAKSVIEFPYQIEVVEETPPPKRGKAAAAAKAPAKKPAAKRKY
jgi:hypothetical protein